MKRKAPSKRVAAHARYTDADLIRDAVARLGARTAIRRLLGADVKQVRRLKPAERLPALRAYADNQADFVHAGGRFRLFVWTGSQWAKLPAKARPAQAVRIGSAWVHAIGI